MGHPGFFTIPQWPLFIFVFLGIAATGIQFLLMSWIDLRSTRESAR